MSVTPTGAPAWVRTVDFADYGGHESKVNYQSQGNVNPRTDVGAEQFARLVSDVAACVRTSPFANIVYDNNDAGTDPPTIQSALMMTGIRLTSYEGDAAPTGFPSAVRNGAGDVTFTFASSYDDEYGVSGAFAPRMAIALGQSGDDFVEPDTAISGQTVRVRCLDQTNSALADMTIMLLVW